MFEILIKAKRIRERSELLVERMEDLRKRLSEIQLILIGGK